MQDAEKMSLSYFEGVKQKAERKRKRQTLMKNKYYESTWNKFKMETESNESESSSTGKITRETSN